MARHECDYCDRPARHRVYRDGNEYNMYSCPSARCLLRVLDDLPGLENAWVEQLPTAPIELNGCEWHEVDDKARKVGE